MNGIITLRQINGEIIEINADASQIISLNGISQASLPFDSNDIQTLQFNGTQLMVTLNNGEIVVLEAPLNVKGEIVPLFDINDVLLFSSISDLLSRLEVSAAGQQANTPADDNGTNILPVNNRETPSRNLTGLSSQAIANQPSDNTDTLVSRSDNDFTAADSISTPNLIPQTIADVFAFTEARQEADTLTGNLLLNDSDPDSNQPLTLSSVAGQSISADPTLVTLPSGLQLSVFSNGLIVVMNHIQIYGDLSAGQQVVDNISYTASDGIDSSAPGTFSISVTGTNDAPVIDSISLNTNTLGNSATLLEENTIGAQAIIDTSTVLATIQASDRDDSELTYNITSGNSFDPDGKPYFQINASGEITLTAEGLADIQGRNAAVGTIELEVTVSDDGTDHTSASTDDNASVITTVSINIGDNSVAPPALQLAANQDNGNSATDNLTNISQPVFNITSVASDARILRISSDGEVLAEASRDNAESDWVIVNNSGTLTFNSSENSWGYQADTLTDGTHTIQISVTDDNNNTAADSLQLNIDTQAPVISDPGTISINENSTVVTQLTAADGSALSYNLADSDDGDLLQIDANGNISFNNAPDFEAPSGGSNNDSNSYKATVIATDAAGNQSEAELIINIMNLDYTLDLDGTSNNTEFSSILTNNPALVGEVSTINLDAARDNREGTYDGLVNVTAEDVLSLTDSNNTLFINGDFGNDFVSFADPAAWTQSATTETHNGIEYNVFTSTLGEESIRVLLEFGQINTTVDEARNLGII